jgi:hypothetical protein
MIVPVLVTAIVLFPFLLYIVFAEETLIPLKIEMHQLTQEEQAKVPVNPNIPDGRGIAEEQEKQHVNDEQGKVLSLEEIMNPFVDREGAAFGALIMSATLITLLAVNASDSGNGKEVPVFYITLPAAVVMFCWDLGSGWISRKKTREIARVGREEKERFRSEQARRAAAGNDNLSETLQQSQEGADGAIPLHPAVSENGDDAAPELASSVAKLVPRDDNSQNEQSTSVVSTPDGKRELDRPASSHRPQALSGDYEEKRVFSERVSSEPISEEVARQQERPTLVSLVESFHRWSQETFPTVTAVLSHLPYALLPFAFSMFVLVQGLVTNGWVPVFAYGWDHVCDFSSFTLSSLNASQIVRRSGNRLLGAPDSTYRYSLIQVMLTGSY